MSNSHLLGISRPSKVRVSAISIISWKDCCYYGSTYFGPFFEILLLSYFRHFFAWNVSYGSILKTPKQENTNVLSISRSQLGHQIVSIVVIWPLHAFSLMGLLIDISSFHDNIQSPPNYETISYSMSSSRSQQTRPYGSVSAGREKWPFNVLFFFKSRASVWPNLMR